MLVAHTALVNHQHRVSMTRPTETQPETLTERQERELAYHEALASRTHNKINEPVNPNIVESSNRRPWNGYWSAYDALLTEALAGKHVLIPGCGYGDDAIRLARLGANVHASDLSPALVDVARQRAARMGVTGIQFSVGPAEKLPDADNSIDVLFLNDILHHLDVPAALVEARRVLKPGARIVVNELYTHTALQRIRDSKLISRFLYSRMVNFIYGTRDPYVTEDERKLDEGELQALEAMLQPGYRLQYFLLFGGRLWPAHSEPIGRLDSVLLNRSDRIGRHLAGRFVLVGTVRK
jgi:ubiquinone/menaquinone biosynthesis C-methylase UbiE